MVWEILAKLTKDTITTTTASATTTAAAAATTTQVVSGPLAEDKIVGWKHS